MKRGLGMKVHYGPDCWPPMILITAGDTCRPFLHHPCNYSSHTVTDSHTLPHKHVHKASPSPTGSAVSKLYSSETQNQTQMFISQGSACWKQKPTKSMWYYSYLHTASQNIQSHIEDISLYPICQIGNMSTENEPRGEKEQGGKKTNGDIHNGCNCTSDGWLLPHGGSDLKEYGSFCLIVMYNHQPVSQSP